MARHLTMTPAEGESLDAFAERMAQKVAEHFDTSPTAPVPVGDSPNERTEKSSTSE